MGQCITLLPIPFLKEVTICKQKKIFAVVVLVVVVSVVVAVVVVNVVVVVVVV